MANGATVKMGVDVTQFKQGMQQAQQSAKTLNAQMKANEAQFKATGDREKYVSEQSKLLKQQLEAQKTAAKNAQQALDAMRKSGVEETSAEYQKMATQLANATAAMYNAQTAMNSLTESEQQAASGAGSVTTALNSIAKQVSLDAVTKGIDKIYDSLKKAGEKAVEVGKNIWDSIMDSASYADDIATMAINLGLTTTQVQQMQYVADRFEAPVESLGRTWKKVKMNITSDSDSVIEAYRELGIATHEVTPGKYGETLGQARDYLDVFWETGEALMNMTDEAERERKAQTLLGRSWEELSSLFTEGREAYEAALADAPAATDEAVKAAAALNDRMKELESSWETLKLEAIGKLAPALETAATSVKGLLDSLTEYLQTDAGQQMMQNLGDAVTKLVDKLLNVNADDLISGATKAVEGLTGALNWFTDNSDTIITVMTVITGTFTAIKLASSAVTLINALKNLGKGGGTGGTGGFGGTNTGSTFTGSTFTGATFTGATLTGATEQITTSNVATMYVQSMIGGNTGLGNGTGIGTGTGGDGLTYTPIMLPAGSGANTTPALSGENSGISGYLPGGSNYASQVAGSSSAGGTQPEVIDLGNGTRVVVNGTPQINTAPAADTSIGPDTAMFGADLGMAAGFVIGQTTQLLREGRQMDDYMDSLLEKYGLDMNRPEVREAVQAAIVGVAVDNYDPNHIDWSNLHLTRNPALNFGLPENIEELLANIAEEYGSDPDGRHRMSENPTLEEVGIAILERASELADQAEAAIEAGTYDEQPADYGDYDYHSTPDYEYGYYGDDWSIEDILNDLGGSAGHKGVPLPFVPEAEDGADEDVQKQLNEMDVVLPAKVLMTGLAGGYAGMRMFANGIWNVPWDGYPALLHRGERVLTARENQQYTYNNYFGNVNLNNGLEIEALTESIDRRNRRQRSGYGVA